MKHLLLTFLSGCFIILANITMAQTKPPVGPAFDKMVKAYVAQDLSGMKSAMPLMDEAYPTHVFTKYFHALINDLSGGDVGQALREYSEIIKLAPDLSDPYVFRAAAFHKKGLEERAIADISKAIALEGNGAYGGWYVDRGNYYAKLKQYNEAYADFKQAITMMPDAAAPYRGLSVMAKYINKTTEAEAIYKKAISGSESGNPLVINAYGEMLLGQQRFAEADAQFTKAFTINDYQPGGDDYDNAGVAAMKVRDYKRAMSLLNKGILADPKSVRIVLNRASVALEQRAWEDVYVYAQKALTLDDDDPNANMMMAVGIKMTNRGDELAAKYELKAKKLENGGK